MLWLRHVCFEPGEDRVSHSRVLAFLAFLVVSFVIIKQLYAGMVIDPELLLGYLAIMVLGETSKGISRHRRDVDNNRFTDRGMNE